MITIVTLSELEGHYPGDAGRACRGDGKTGKERDTLMARSDEVNEPGNTNSASLAMIHVTVGIAALIVLTARLFSVAPRQFLSLCESDP
ncbi:MAG: hypothetical protein EOQ57_32520 [Mesorhizobium sp.]|uniref:hypothetical protein n=1 Tax=Mesorhizobium sp. TaxID=1871066 RepID=UPI000FE51500|nr:hypothetical protein [Mesorhizobium sp.]RWB94150.1 MAG: hypothetical protein EOQ57_32520 [Mesorhizobium sp.]TIS44431.1 MAG: hypothetical protein E5W96_36460 [Mesorhizobium sp.]